MTPNFLKSGVGGGAGHIPPPQSITGSQISEGSSINKTDGNHNAKSKEQGANSATKGADVKIEGLHGSLRQAAFADQVIRVQPATGEETTGYGTSILSKEGAIGKQFNADGAIGGTAQSVGGPLDQQGMIGKHFNAGGLIGGTFQQIADKNEQH